MRKGVEMMWKAALCLFILFGLAVSSGVEAEAFWTTSGFPLPNTVSLLDLGAPPQNGVAITGWQPAEVSQGIAVRPATGELYLVGSSSRLYRLNPATGVATAVGVPFVPAL